MNYTTWEELIQESDVLVEGETLSVYRAFEHVQDGRCKRGVRVPRGIDPHADCARQIGGDGDPTRYRGVAEKGVARDAGELSVRGDRKPTCYKLSMPSRVNEVITQLLTRVGAMKRCGDEPSRLLGQAEREEHVHVALDGKTLRGTDAAMRPLISVRCIRWCSMRWVLGWCSKSRWWERRRTN